MRGVREDVVRAIAGAERLTGIFGRWPSFHDAEIVRLALERAPRSGKGPDLVVDVYAFRMTADVQEDGSCRLDDHVLVSLRFGGIGELCLDGFNEQNVLFELEIGAPRSPGEEGCRFEVTFHSSYGASAVFLCRSIAVEDVRPWDASAQGHAS